MLGVGGLAEMRHHEEVLVVLVLGVVALGEETLEAEGDFQARGDAGIAIHFHPAGLLRGSVIRRLKPRKRLVAARIQILGSVAQRIQRAKIHLACVTGRTFQHRIGAHHQVVGGILIDAGGIRPLVVGASHVDQAGLARPHGAQRAGRGVDVVGPPRDPLVPVATIAHVMGSVADYNLRQRV